MPMRTRVWPGSVCSVRGSVLRGCMLPFELCIDRCEQFNSRNHSLCHRLMPSIHTNTDKSTWQRGATDGQCFTRSSATSRSVGSRLCLGLQWVLCVFAVHTVSN